MASFISELACTCMNTSKLVLLAAVCLFCLTCLVACENNAPADQLTVVQGTVTSADTGRPLHGVLMAVQPYSKGLTNGPLFRFAGDSVRTDVQGKYRLQFYNKKGLYYAISLEPFIDGVSYEPHYLFAAGSNGASYLGFNSQDIALGRLNTVDFKPNELRTVAVRVRNSNTGYQRLDLNYRTLRGNNLDTLVYLHGFYLPATGVKVHYYSASATGTIVKDTAVALVVLNPAALPPDTLRATLTFIR
jgi:hypothetical protein